MGVLIQKRDRGIHGPRSSNISNAIRQQVPEYRVVNRRKFFQF